MSSKPQTLATAPDAALHRLHALVPLPDEEVAWLEEATHSLRTLPSRTEVIAEGEPILSSMILFDGWACRARLLADGRRQVLGLLLPGDLIGICDRPNPLSLSSVMTLTRATLADVPLHEMTDSGDRPALTTACRVSGGLDEAYLLNQITRLGRQTAYERIAHLFLELCDRLKLAGRCEGSRFSMPLTQEVLADTLGLTSVHVNRTLQQLRREHMVELGEGTATLLDPDALALAADYRAPIVSW